MNPDKNREYRYKCLKIVQKYIECFDNDGNQIQFIVKEFLDDCHYLTKSYYEDLTIERASIDFCGYTLCTNRLSKTSKNQFKLNQIYHIHQNKVYDITRRKNFCSNQCFKQSEHIKDQLSSEPYFMRKNDDDQFHQIKLYDGHDYKCGDEFKLITLENKSNGEQKSKLQNSVLKNEKTIESKLSAPYLKEEEFNELKEKFRNFNIQEKFANQTEISTKFSNKNQNNEEQEQLLLDEIDRMSISTASSISDLSMKSTNSKRGMLKKRKFYENIVKKISSWITDDTRNLLKINAVKQNSIPQLPEIVDNVEDDEKKLQRYRWQYIRLCARLNEEEIEDEKYDRMVCDSGKKRSKTNKKSVFKQIDHDLSPDKLWNLFTCPAILSTMTIGNDTKKVHFANDVNGEKIESEKNDNDEEIFFRPLNDNQHACVKRKQIFLQEIHTFLHEILDNQIEIDEISDHIHSLINTLNLNAATTTMGRKENFLITIFLFRIILRYRMIDKSNELETIYRTNIFIAKILDRFQLTYESIDKSIDEIFNLHK
ncbi:hypothetical protein HUG17_5695 [Dermatophagoides farinae]|uniref:RNA polymerase II subunit B1 CTD phosphatase RPAP2 homolog n=1 Tax=Dermatophagoides farinae TaxID=6954 RepID=A0A9D4P264_DERFA|nr:putative RNA polymerase II subunit B1 CTD phosphatase RPAP2 [Dermatophagoides farinae]KAH7642648.1 hypothetical protein HUG17_5695 [Dermatophagoides farinae]